MCCCLLISDSRRTASVGSLRAGKGRLHGREDALAGARAQPVCRKQGKVAENAGVPLRAASGRACARRAGARLHARQVRGARAAPGVQQRTRVGKKLPAVICADDRPLAGVCHRMVHQQLQAHLAAPASLVRLSSSQSAANSLLQSCRPCPSPGLMHSSGHSTGQAVHCLKYHQSYSTQSAHDAQAAAGCL